MLAYLNWSQNGILINGFDGTDWIDTGITLPVSFPSTTTPPQTITVINSSRDLRTYETFTNVRLYLSGDPNQIAFVQGYDLDAQGNPQGWPYLGANPNDLDGPHPNPGLDGGFYISFDSGRTFTVFDQKHGYEADPSTWILLPQESIGLNATDGTLEAFDMASMIVQYRIPQQANQLQIINVRIAADFDIV
jgi:hypothetical protein